MAYCFVTAYFIVPLAALIYSLYYIYSAPYFTNLVIIILSARSNFEQRQTIRDTWVKNLGFLENAFHIFSIGEGCMIPPLDRIDSTSCVEWHNNSIHLINNKKWLSVACFNRQEKEPQFVEEPLWYNGFGFKVLHPIQLFSVGCHVKLFNSRKNVTIVLRDAEENLHTQNISIEICSFIKEEFCFMNLVGGSFLLPKGFEGELVINFPDLFTSNFQEFKDCTWNNGSSVVYTFGRNKKAVYPFNDKHCSFISAYFETTNFQSLLNHFEGKSQRFKDWTLKERQINDRIAEEKTFYKDIVTLNNVVDVYSNLPNKLISTFNWVVDNYRTLYLLKVDDDTYLNVKKFEKIASGYLQSKDKFSMEFPTIWSHFHYHRTVPLFGKWADYEYQSITYPPFPSGAGYLLSENMLLLLSKMAFNMRYYQGEDITIGIWSEILGHRASDGRILPIIKKDVDCWLSSPFCSEPYLIPQRDKKQMLEMHSLLDLDAI